MKSDTSANAKVEYICFYLARLVFFDIITQMRKCSKYFAPKLIVRVL